VYCTSRAMSRPVARSLPPQRQNGPSRGAVAVRGVLGGDRRPGEGRRRVGSVVGTHGGLSQFSRGDGPLCFPRTSSPRKRECPPRPCRQSRLFIHARRRPGKPSAERGPRRRTAEWMRAGQASAPHRAPGWPDCGPRVREVPCRPRGRGGISRFFDAQKTALDASRQIPYSRRP
jgi:hypothetical protein